MKRLLAVTVCLALLFGCAGVKPQKPDTRELRAGLNLWRAFRMEGVATVEAGGFALHKKAVLRKNDGIMRLDLLESGLFAASPQPFLVVYVDTALVIQSPIIKATEPLSPEVRALLPSNAWLDALLAEHAAEILATRSVALADVTITFDAHYRIRRIATTDEDAFVNITYNSAGKPEQVEMQDAGGRRVLLLVDSFSPGAEHIPPLAIPETQS